MLKSGFRVTVSGLNTEKFFNKLNRLGIAVSDVVRHDRKTVTVTVPYRKRRQFLDLSEERCYTVINCEAVGVYSAVEFARKHIVAACAILLLAPLLYLMSSVCLKVKVSGVIDTDRVVSCVEEYGVRVGSFFPSFDKDKLENFLAVELEADFVTVSRKGSTLFVGVTPKVKLPPPVDFDKSYNITALQDGIVTRIICISGTAEVKVGDKVKKGQVLIRGVRTFNDGTTEPVRALGEVYAEVSSSGRAEFSSERVVYTPTEEYFSRTVVVVGANELYLKEVPFEHFSVTEKECVLYPLNIKIVSQTFCKLAVSTISVTMDECLEELYLNAYEKALAAANFTAYETVYVKDNAGVTVTLKGTALISAGSLT